MQTVLHGGGGQLVQITLHILICNLCIKSIKHPDLSLQQTNKQMDDQNIAVEVASNFMYKNRSIKTN